MQLTLTKFSHSCLLAQDDEGGVALFDPGEFSLEYQEALLSSISRLDDLIITHEHSDHFSPEFVRAVLAKFPDTKITATDAVLSQLREAGIMRQQSEKSSRVELFEAPHASLAFGEPPANIGVHYKSVLTDPGDSHDFHESKAILAMPMTAPWGSMTNAVAKIAELKPHYVIPIHDWHWRPEAAQRMYVWFKREFAAMGIEFVIAGNNQPFSIQIG